MQQLYFKTLRLGNVRQMDWFRNKLVHYIIDHKHASNYGDKHTGYYGIGTIRIRNVFIVSLKLFLKLSGALTRNGTARFFNANNCLNTNISSYLETSRGQNSNLYLNVVHFFNTSVN
jgi:hypothetical protein